MWDKRKGRHGVRRGAGVVLGRALLAGDPHPLLRLLVEGLEVVEVDGPVESDAVEGAQSEVLGRVPGYRSPPVHRRPSDHHGAVHLAFPALISDVVPGVGVLAIGQHPAAGTTPLLKGNGALSGLHHDDPGIGSLGEALRHHRSRDARSDDADVGLDHPSHDPSPSSGGIPPTPSSPRHRLEAIRRP